MKKGFIFMLLLMAAHSLAAQEYRQLFTLPLDEKHFTTDPLIKLLPFTVSVKAAAPAVTNEGEILLSIGTGLAAALIVNVAPLLVPPPGVAVNTVIVAVPAALTFAAGTLAVNCVALT